MKICFIYLILTLLAAGCSLTVVSVDSNPQGAIVRVKPLGNGEFKEVGKTPLVIESKDLSTYMEGSGPVVIEIEKEGYKTESLLITELDSLDLRVVRSLKREEGVQDPRRLNQAIGEFFDVQRLVRATIYKEALEKLTELEKRHPQLAIVHELRGGIYMLQEKYPEALDAYVLAVKLEPANVEAIRMRDILASTLGVGLPNPDQRVPAATENSLPKKESQ